MDCEAKNRRLQNAAFALIIGAVLGVTLWSIHSREPIIVNLRARPIEKIIERKPADQTRAEMPKSTDAAAVKDEPSVDDKQVSKTKGKIETMIERGALSKHPAMYYKKVEK